MIASEPLSGRHRMLLLDRWYGTDTLPELGFRALLLPKLVVVSLLFLVILFVLARDLTRERILDDLVRLFDGTLHLIK